MKVLVIDDNLELSRLIKEFLELKSYKVVVANDAQTARAYIDNEKFDLYIIDIHLQDANGIDILEYIRKKDITTPVIIITSSNEVDNFVNSFKNGANEFIKKPFYFEELDIRINNLLNKPLNKLVKISDELSFDLEKEELFINHQMAKLRKKEKKFLAILVKNINQTVRTKEITDFVWDDKKVNYPLRQLVSNLKNRFPILKEYIKTIPKTGYMIVSQQD